MRALFSNPLSDQIVKKRKDPNSTLDYKFDWTDWLGNDVIASAIVEISNNATTPLLVAELPVISADSKSVTVWVSGGALNTIPRLTVRITTVGDGTHNRIDDRSLDLEIINQ